MSATEFVEQLAKILPIQQVYNDALAPGVKQIGYTLEDVIKCIRLATFPIQVGSASQEQFRAFLHRSVDKVPEGRRILPAPQILGPVLEGIRYEPEGSEAEEMFAELLSRSMDRERVRQAHPAFPHLIRQLSRDEGHIIRLVKAAKRDGRTLKKTLRHKMTSDFRFAFEEVELDEFPKGELLYPANIDFYVNHLWYLGLAGIFEYKNQEAIYDKVEEAARGGEPGRQIGSREFREYRLTDLGSLLADAVMK